jgi:hypothetical protein
MTTISRPRIGWRGLAWVTWRQHRAAITLTTGLALLATLLIMLRAHHITPDPRSLLSYRLAVDWMPYTPTVLGATVAVFWAAPLLSREYETHTHLLAWSQDVSPRRWLTSKVVPLALLAAALTAVLCVAVGVLVNQRSFESEVFEANPFVHATYTLFGFALGLAISALTRQTLVAMGATLVIFLATRAFFAVLVRPYYLPPLHRFRLFEPPGVAYVQQSPDFALLIDSGYADAAGVPMDLPNACTRPSETNDIDACLRNNGVAGHFVEYQPIERMSTFQLIESGIFVLMAAGLFAFAFIWIKRQRRI